MEKTNNQKIIEIEKFISIEKFNVSKEFFYQGISGLSLQERMTRLINGSAKDFIEVIKSGGHPGDFVKQIKKGLLTIDVYKFDLDTNDKEMVCFYYQRLMDIVGLESSNGLLNTWLYGFDPLSQTVI